MSRDTMSTDAEAVEVLLSDDCTDCEMVGINTTIDGVDNFKIESTEDGVLKIYQCEECDKTFAQASNLKRHERTHTGERPFSCSTCGRCFAQGNNLKAHLRLHTGERPYTCTLCNRTFAQSSNLYKHMRYHGGSEAEQNRQFGCAVCGKWFLESNMLKTHLRTHTGERPYACDLCEKSFSQDSNLRRHRRVHTGDKPYSCPICSRAFSQSNNLKAHMSVHFSAATIVDDVTVQLFSCDECDESFLKQSKLSRHKVTTHGGPKIVVINKLGQRLQAKRLKLEVGSDDV